MNTSRCVRWVVLLLALSVCLGPVWGDEDRSDLAGGGAAPPDSDCEEYEAGSSGESTGVEDCEARSGWERNEPTGPQPCYFYDSTADTATNGSAHDDLTNLLNCLVGNLMLDPPQDVEVLPDIDETLGVYGFKFTKLDENAKINSFCFRESDKNMPMISLHIEEDHLTAKIRKVTQIPEGNTKIIINLNDPLYQNNIEIDVDPPGPFGGYDFGALNDRIMDRLGDNHFVTSDSLGFINVVSDGSGNGIQHIRWWSQDPQITITEVALEKFAVSSETECTPGPNQ